MKPINKPRQTPAHTITSGKGVRRREPKKLMQERNEREKKKGMTAMQTFFIFLPVQF